MSHLQFKLLGWTLAFSFGISSVACGCCSLACAVMSHLGLLHYISYLPAFLGMYIAFAGISILSGSAMLQPGAYVAKHIAKNCLIYDVAHAHLANLILIVTMPLAALSNLTVLLAFIALQVPAIYRSWMVLKGARKLLPREIAILPAARAARVVTIVPASIAMVFSYSDVPGHGWSAEVIRLTWTLSTSLFIGAAILFGTAFYAYASSTRPYQHINTPRDERVIVTLPEMCFAILSIILVVVYEETVYRGVIFSLSERVFESTVAAIALGWCLFFLMHLHLPQNLRTAARGIAFYSICVLFLLSPGGLSASIAFHAAYNVAVFMSTVALKAQL